MDINILVNNKKVFSKETFDLSGINPHGGHVFPNSLIGVSELKNVPQNHATKKSASLKNTPNMPTIIPSLMQNDCSPSNDSIDKSPNHIHIIITKIMTIMFKFLK